ncbi:hypothetical protein A3B60_03115 [Candidatus Peregrinibacteria bacterium RIFCSPLOWO2_01_FULL_39_12]|nr:MAG: hypothetical protein A3B60_03115 [Candidatus Peregrinibacteria bacterium RIFCSPLOWO2_01_FULL_39_12]
MTKEELKRAIKKLLETSKISDHLKSRINILLGVMDETALNNIYTSLSTEKDKVDKIAEKKKRVELKYQVMVEKLSDMKSKQ